MVDLLSNKPREELVSFDLGWLIQNGRVSDEELCSFLIDEISAEIERLVSLFLKSPADRMAVVDQIIFQVLLRRRSFKGTISGKAWLYKLILEESMKRLPRKRGKDLQPVISAIDTRLPDEAHFSQFMDTLTEVQRLIVTLHYGQNLSAEEIALLLKISPESVLGELEQPQQKLWAHQYSCEVCSNHNNSLAALETTFTEALQQNSRLIETAHENTKDWARSLLTRLRREKTRQRTRKWISRAAEFSLGVFILLISEIGFTHSWPSLPWATHPTASITHQPAFIQPNPQPPLETPVPVSPAVSNDLDQKISDVIKFSLTSWARWKTLWANVEVNNYFIINLSDGSSVPIPSKREQIWLSPPGSSRVLSGYESNGYPNTAYTIINGKILGQNYSSGQVIDDSSPKLIPDADLQKLFSPLDISSLAGQFTWVGSDTIAGRPSWVVEWVNNGYRLYRFWIDQEYGVILRRIDYAEMKSQPVISDVQVTRIFFNADFPSTIFEPNYYKGDHFVYDFSGTPEINNLKTALQSLSPSIGSPSITGKPHTAGGDYSNSQLSFQNVPAGSSQKPGEPGVELFAGQVDLGQLPLGGKSVQTCQRSPDGNWIAYNSPPDDASGNTALYVADVASLQSARPALAGGITAGDFAFSPDRRHLAFFGCEKATNFCGIFILDLTTWQLTHLTPLNYADYMIWSPDSRSLALVGEIDFTEANKMIRTWNFSMSEVSSILDPWNFQIVDIRSGNVIFRSFFDWSNLSAPPLSPTKSWSTPFKIPTTGVDGCINPPKKVGNKSSN